MRKFYVMIIVLCLVMMISGCKMTTSDNTDASANFDFTLPEGFVMEDVTDTACSVVRDGETVGGFILTDMKVSDLTDSRSAALLLYLENIAEGTEYFSWEGGDSEHPIQYLSQYFTDSHTQEKREYYRVFFVRDSSVYDMWFDTELIDEDAISEFLPIAGAE